MMKYYVLIIENDIEPTVVGPFNSKEDRDQEAKRLRFEDEDNGIFALDSEGEVDIQAYSGGYLRGVFD